MPTRSPHQPAVGNKAPKQSWTTIVQTSLKARDLATTHAAALGDRISPAFLAQFASDLASLQAAIPAAITTKQGAVQSTAAQNAELLRARYLIAGVRKAVRGQTTDPEIRLAYGVGVKTFLLFKNIKAALQTIIARAASEPAEAASFGVSGTDVAAANAALAAIEAADSAQEAARAAAPNSTRTRNAIARRLLAAIKLIQGAGMRTFADDASTRELFVALR